MQDFQHDFRSSFPNSVKRCGKNPPIDVNIGKNILENTKKFLFVAGVIYETLDVHSVSHEILKYGEISAIFAWKKSNSHTYTFTHPNFGK